MSARIKAVGAVLPALLIDIAGVAGAALVSYGGWLILPAAGVILAGVQLLAGAWLCARPPAAPPSAPDRGP